MALFCSTRVHIFLLLLNANVGHVQCPDYNFSEIGRFMDDYCPYNVMCRTGPPKLVSKSPGQVGCCTDCSCEETCGLTKDCCFPSLDKYHIIDRGHQKCIPPFSNFENLDQDTGFYMVVDEFPIDKGTHCRDNVTKCGENENATSIGSLYPVFSKKTGRIYKNIECAKCHGLHEVDVIKWQVWLACDENNSLFPVDVMTSLNGIETGKLSKLCGYQFVYPGPISDIRTEQCVINPKDSCSKHFNVFDLNLSHEEVRDQCLYGVYSPYRIRYKNIFCYICSPFLTGFDTDVTCRSNDEPNRLTTVSFAALLDTNIIDNKIPEKQGVKTRTRIACPRKKWHGDKRTAFCREVYCPTGQVLSYNGKCGFPSKQWGPVVFELNIKIVPRFDDIKVDVLNNGNINFSAMIANQTLSPWPRAWTVLLFMYTAKTTQNGDSVIDHFLVKMELRKQKTNIDIFLNYIQINLRQDWYLNLNGSIFANKQVLSGLTDFNRIRNGNGNNYTYTHKQTRSEYLDLPEFPVYTELVFLSYMPSLSVTKMFFCEQIQLKPDEYELDTYSKVLFHIRQKRIFSLGEFSYLIDEGHISFVRICIEDSLFQLQQSRASKCLRSILAMIFLVILHMKEK